MGVLHGAAETIVADGLEQVVQGADLVALEGEIAAAGGENDDAALVLPAYLLRDSKSQGFLPQVDIDENQLIGILFPDLQKIRRSGKELGPL